jgi:selenide,water dikinase
MTKGNAKPGDLLLITKPLGTGVTTTALKAGRAKSVDIDQVIGWMSRLNDEGMQLAKACAVQAATDVTGFGLLGHAVEMAQASGAGLRFNLPGIPFYRSARKYAEEGYFPAGSVNNRSHFGAWVQFDPDIDEVMQMMMFDAQTSGGLLLAVERERLGAALEAATPASPFWVIGAVTEQKGVRVTTYDQDLELPMEAQGNELWFAAVE